MVLTLYSVVVYLQLQEGQYQCAAVHDLARSFSLFLVAIVAAVSMARVFRCTFAAALACYRIW